jgi:hypothetical protein
MLHHVDYSVLLPILRSYLKPPFLRRFYGAVTIVGT